VSVNISFHYEEIDFHLPEEAKSNKWLKSILINEDQKVADIEYIFCDDAYLLEINRRYLDHDFFTDIITFPMSEDPLEATIYISVDRVKENASEFATSFEEEMHRVMAHGLLHLLGYGDKTEVERLEMREKENQYLATRG